MIELESAAENNVTQCKELVDKYDVTWCKVLHENRIKCVLKRKLRSIREY